jgi:glutathione S-transferase
MEPRLWISRGTCSLAPHILLHEAGIPFSTTEISVKNGFPAEYARVNPKKKVPTLGWLYVRTYWGVKVPILELGPEVLTENPAIMTAIAQLAPEKQLFGKTNLDVVRTYEWLNWLSGTLHAQAFGGLFRPARFVDDEAMFAEVRSKGRATVEECYRYIDEKLQDKDWMVGQSFTAADAYALVFYLWGVKIEFEMEEKYPNYTRLVTSLGERVSVKAALDKEGITLKQAA